MAESRMPDWMRADDAVTAMMGALSDARSDRPSIVLLDGRSGSGKTTLAGLVAEQAPDAQIIHLDDIYPGWHGLESAREHLRDFVLEPLASGRPATWQRWDWETDAGAGWNSVDPDAPILIEGVGAVSAASRARATLAVWIELGVDARRERALARDGDRFAPHWDQWARHEYDFIARERPRDHAEVIVDGRTIAR